MNRKTLAEMTDAEREAFEAERQALRNQILRDQETNAKRDAKALARERAWERKHRRG